MNGFYVVYYTGKTGSGFAIIVFRDGIITGADASGGLYDGKYTVSEDKRGLEGTIVMTVPPVVSLVIGAPISQVSYTQQFPISLSLDTDQNQSLRLQTPSGPINLNLKKLRDFAD